MIDLKNTTFIIPVRIESADRMRNVITILCYLLENFDTNVILKEVDTKSVYEEEVFPGKHFHIPINSRHRMTAGDQGVLFIEVQYGECSEDDIVRLEDDYGRMDMREYYTT